MKSARKSSRGNDPSVVVTGGSGRIGHILVKRLLEEGNNVRALIHQKSGIRDLPQGAIPIVGDITSRGDMDDAFGGADTVYHIAGLRQSAKASTKEMMLVNVEGTKNVAAACVKSRVKQLVFASTTDVYGNKRDGVIDESTEPFATDKYGYTKMLAEQEIVKSGAPYTILRLGTIYGPGFEHSFFKIFKAVEEGSVVIIGSGNNHLPMIHVDDVIDALLLVMQKRDASLNKIYNVTDGQEHTQEYLMKLAADFLGVEAPRRHVQEIVVRLLAKTRGIDSDELRFLTSNRLADISRIERDLGWRPKVRVEQGGKQLVQDFVKKHDAQITA